MVKEPFRTMEVFKMNRKKFNPAVTHKLLMCGSISIAEPCVLVKRDIMGLWEILWSVYTHPRFVGAQGSLHTVRDLQFVEDVGNVVGHVL